MCSGIDEFPSTIGVSSVVDHDDRYVLRQRGQQLPEVVRAEVANGDQLVIPDATHSSLDRAVGSQLPVPRRTAPAVRNMIFRSAQSDQCSI